MDNRGIRKTQGGEHIVAGTGVTGEMLCRHNVYAQQVPQEAMDDLAEESAIHIFNPDLLASFQVVIAIDVIPAASIARNGYGEGI